MTEYKSFRQSLDAVLRTRTVQEVSNFLIAENQWEPGVPEDPETAMWMMIAGSTNLRDLHQEARQWLISHGHAEEATAILDGRKAEEGNGQPGAGREQKTRTGSRKIRREL